MLKEETVCGQWDVAARFWAARFCGRLFSGEISEGGEMERILGGGGEMVTVASPVGENGGEGSAGAVVSEVWEIGTKAGGRFVVVAGTGEVIGTVERPATRNVTVDFGL